MAIIERRNIERRRFSCCLIAAQQIQFFSSATLLNNIIVYSGLCNAFTIRYGETNSSILWYHISNVPIGNGWRNDDKEPSIDTLELLIISMFCQGKIPLVMMMEWKTQRETESTLKCNVTWFFTDKFLPSVLRVFFISVNSVVFSYSHKRILLWSVLIFSVLSFS